MESSDNAFLFTNSQPLENDPAYVAQLLQAHKISKTEALSMLGGLGYLFKELCVLQELE